MRALLLVGLLLLVPWTLTPAAATGTCQPVALVMICAGDYGNYAGCQDEPSFESERTGVAVSGAYASVAAGGAHNCYNFCIPWFGCYRGESRGVHADAYVIFVGTANVWWSQGASCTTYVAVSTLAVSHFVPLGCPVGGSPPLPWGHVLP